jgi:hypothetical protein
MDLKTLNIVALLFLPLLPGRAASLFTDKAEPMQESRLMPHSRSG